MKGTGGRRAADKNLAVLRIDAPANRLRPIPLGTSKELQVGQSVFAIGNPFGLDQSLTTGVISALCPRNRFGDPPSYSRGHSNRCSDQSGKRRWSVLDSAGRLIGVNTQIYSRSGASAGIGFAIPVDTVNRIVPELIRRGKIIRPGLGVELAEEQIARKIEVSGVLIANVMRGGPAAKAGIQPTRRESSGRVILGDVVTLALLRDGKIIQAKVTLEVVS